LFDINSLMRASSLRVKMLSISKYAKLVVSCLTFFGMFFYWW